MQLFKRIFTALILLALSANISYSKGYWKVIYEKPHHGIASFHAFDENTLILQESETLFDNITIVYMAEIIKKSTDGGESWEEILRFEDGSDEIILEGLTGDELHSVTQIIASNTGVITGYMFHRNYVLRSEDRGKTWKVQPIAPPYGIDSTYGQVSMQVYGDSCGSYRPGSNANNRYKDEVLVTFNAWKTVDTLYSPHEELYPVAFLFANDTTGYLDCTIYDEEKEDFRRIYYKYIKDKGFTSHIEIDLPFKVNLVKFNEKNDIYVTGYSKHQINEDSVAYHGHLYKYISASDEWKELFEIKSGGLGQVEMLNDDFGYLSLIDREEGEDFEKFGPTITLRTHDGWATHDTVNRDSRFWIGKIGSFHLISETAAYSRTYYHLCKYIDEPLSVNDMDNGIKENLIEVYPAPYKADKPLSIKFTSPFTQETSILINDISGNTIKRFRMELIKGEEYELSWQPERDLSPGVYFVGLFALNQPVYSEKFIIEK